MTSKPEAIPRSTVAATPRYDLNGTYRGRMVADGVTAVFTVIIKQTGDRVAMNVLVKLVGDNGAGPGSDNVDGRIVGDRIEAGGKIIRIVDGGRTLVDQTGLRLSK